MKLRRKPQEYKSLTKVSNPPKEWGRLYLMSGVRILVAHEEYGDRYMRAGDLQELHNSCKKLLAERLENGYYNAHKPKEEALTDEQIDALPERLKEDAITQNRYLKRDWENYEWQVSFLSKVEDVLSRGTIEMHRKYPVSYCLLDQRSDYEYERIELEHLE